MLILVVGASGAGKDTLLHGVRAEMTDHAPVRFVRRVITRAASDGGEGEEEHEAVSEQAFELRDQAGEFALSWRAHGLRYGIPSDISVDLAHGRVVIANVSRAVLAEAADKFPVGVVEVTAPEAMRAARLAARGREDAADVARRLSREIEVKLRVTRVTVVNDGSVADGVVKMWTAIREAAGLDAVGA